MTVRHPRFSYEPALTIVNRPLRQSRQPPPHHGQERRRSNNCGWGQRYCFGGCTGCHERSRSQAQVGYRRQDQDDCQNYFTSHHQLQQNPGSPSRLQTSPSTVPSTHHRPAKPHNPSNRNQRLHFDHYLFSSGSPDTPSTSLSPHSHLNDTHQYHTKIWRQKIQLLTSITHHSCLSQGLGEMHLAG